jgi:hypothetical protein
MLLGDRCHDFKNIFAEKFLAKKWRVLFKILQVGRRDDFKSIFAEKFGVFD